MHWFDVLKAVRRISHGGDRTFSARDLAVDPLFEAFKGEGDRPDRRIHNASAWLGKFSRWGYVKRVGSAKEDKRWVRTFEITGYGLDRPEPGPPPEWPEGKRKGKRKKR